MEQKTFLEILKRYQRGEATPEEKTLIDDWYEAIGEPAREISSVGNNNLENFYWEAIAQKAGLNKRLHDTSGSEHQGKTRFLRVAAGIAASLVLVSVSAYYWISSEQVVSSTEAVKVFSQKLGAQPEPSTLETWNELINAQNSPQQFILADGSTVMLEPKSKLRVSSTFNKIIREVYLDGEGFFNVTHNVHIPFIVYTGQVTTRVLGTSFIVKALQQDRKVTVTVKTGLVSVITNPSSKTTQTEVILTPNQELTYDQDQEVVSKHIVDKPQPLVGEEGIKRIRFEDQHVSEIFAAIEKAYGVKIVFDEDVFSSCKLTTTLTDGDLFNRLDIISSAIGATYVLEEDKIVFSGKGCE